MIAPELAELLRRAMGLDAASLGTSSIERALAERERACGLQGQSYLEHVRRGGAELQALVEALVVPETWFFRDAELFAALPAALGGGAAALAQRSLRLLSVPCSSGEEPYSIAMTLLDAGFAGESFSIDAVDISLAALERARTGVYGRNSFRGADLAFRERHFERSEAGHRVCDAVRRPVRLHHGNLIDPAFLADAGQYDAIFCRNLLIYFDRELQERAARALCARLAEGGWLFAAAAEAGPWLRAGLVSARLAQGCALRRSPASAAVAAASPAPTAARAAGRARPASAPAPRRRERARSAPAACTPRPASAAAADGGELGEAERLADQGRLAEAIERCERHLQTHGPDPRAYYLLGLARDAEGHAEQAEELYRKALYLEPTHCAALTQLACLLEKQGDEAGARRLRERAARAERRSGEDS